MKIIFKALCVTAVLGIFIIGYDLWNNKPAERIVCEMFDSELIIPHAGGITPEGKTESNSLEALEKSYEDGYRVIELDFSWLDESHLVCVHDWKAFYSIFHAQENPAFEEFDRIRSTTYDFTSLTLEHLTEWLSSHRDAVIVTDIKDEPIKGARLIAEGYPQLMDRFIIQIYSFDEYEEIVSLGFENVILTLYGMPSEKKLDAKALAEFITAHELLAVTFPVQMLDIDAWYEQIKECGVPLMVHTVNDTNEQDKLFEKGISGIYSDLSK